MTNSKVSRVILSFDDGRKDNIDVAEKVLKETNYDVKLSILMILTGLDINEAKEKLSQNKGYIAKAMETI